MDLEVTQDDIEAAANRIAPHIRHTPILELGDPFDLGFRLSLKLEHLQLMGSFKTRGAFSVLTARDVPDVGVAAASGGNFGIAIAHACSQLNYRATVFVPGTSPTEKIDRITHQGAEVRVIPGYYDAALAECRRFAGETGAFAAHAYDQPEVVAGQGTVAREITSQLPDVDAIVVAVGGGGLIGGIASWCRGDVEVVAAEPERCQSLHAARAAGQPVSVEVSGVAASSLGAQRVGEIPWHANRWIADSVLVTDDDIVEAQRWIWQNTRLVVEPAAATTMAALMTGAYGPGSGSHVVALLSGGNLDPSSLG